MTPIVSRSHLLTRRHFTRRSGAIAQLGERVVRNDEVGGSIPPGSTSLRRLRLLRLGKPHCGEGGPRQNRSPIGEDGLYFTPPLPPSSRPARGSANHRENASTIRAR